MRTATSGSHPAALAGGHCTPQPVPGVPVSNCVQGRPHGGDASLSFPRHAAWAGLPPPPGAPVTLQGPSSLHLRCPHCPLPTAHGSTDPSSGAAGQPPSLLHLTSRLPGRPLSSPLSPRLPESALGPLLQIQRGGRPPGPSSSCSRGTAQCTTAQVPPPPGSLPGALHAHAQPGAAPHTSPVDLHQALW